MEVSPSFLKHLHQFLQQQVENGSFQSIDEVVQASLNMLARTASYTRGSTKSSDQDLSKPAVDHLSDIILRSAIDFGIISFDLTGRITSWNTGANRIFGWSKTDMLGESAERIFTAKDVANGRPATEMREALETGRGKDERWHLRSDGRQFWAVGEMFVLRALSGEPVGFMKMLRDRTEQHHLMRNLLNDRTRTEIAADTGLISFFEWDVGSQLIRGDQRFADLYGFDADAVDAGLPVDNYMARVHHDDVEMLKTVSSAAIESASDYTQQYRIHARGNVYQHVLVRARCMIQEGQRASRFIGVAIDITAAKIAESSLKDTEEFNRRILAASSDCIKVLDLDGTLRFMSEGGRRVMEVDDFAQIAGTSWLDRWTGKAREQAQAALEAARRGETGHFSGPAPTAKGNARFWDVVVTPINGADARPERLLVISRDMTRAHEAELALRASDGRWRDVFEKLDEGIIVGQVVRDADGHVVDWRYVDVNDAWGRQVGIEARTAVGHTIRDLFPGIEQSWVDQVAEVVDNEKPGMFIRQVGNLGRWYEGRIYPADKDRFYIIFIEITARVRAEARKSSLHDLGERLLASETIEAMSAVAAETIGGALGVAGVGNSVVVADFERVPEASQRMWSDEDITFMREVEQRARGAIERRQAELVVKDAERLRIALAELSDHLRNVEDLNALQLAAAEVIGTTLHADRVGYGRVFHDDQTFEVPNDWTRADFPSLAGSYHLDDYGKYADELRTGKTVVIEDVVTDWRTADNSEPLQRLHVGSLINHPVVEHGRTVAILYVNTASPRLWSPKEIDFVREAADRLRQAAERRYAEISLKNLNAELEYAVEIRTAERNRMWKISPDLMMILSPDGHYRETNPSWASLLGYSPDELSGLYATSLVHPDDINATDKALRAAAKASPPIFENRLIHKDGSYRWVQWALAPSGGEVFGTGRDITEAKEARTRLEQAEEQLRQSQKMEAVGQLTGGLAHDFNNLLASISGGLQVLKFKLQRGQFNGLERYIDIGESSVRRAAALTQRLLAFSRRQTLDPKPTNVNRLVADMDELVRRSVGPMVQVEIVDAPDLWPTRIDASQLENALLNLCINARDAMMPAGGKLTLVCANRSIDEHHLEPNVSPGEYVVLSVSDTGSGMPPEVIKRIFDPFYTTKPLGEGTGLGLSMVYGFVHQSGGQVRVRSEVGIGTTMSLYLPRYVGTVAAEDSIANVPLESGHGETVLVIEDEPALRELIGELLRDAGYRVFTAQDGPTGLQVLRSNTHIDLLITDVGLPGGLNGRQVADASRIWRQDLKVLFITGYADAAVIGNGGLAPGMEVMTKPFDISIFANRIGSLLTSKNT
ncbi:PAS domain S-box protein [Massilia phyllosphaerae]|uniref:PAS domain S-box protein n=1 Tax=Massilia phyllosphaerae TaxID=3106034 RepID=UPI002B1CD69B|nr:PAS domain S-box protein [Massilia sp. SGZ-792]